MPDQQLLQMDHESTSPISVYDNVIVGGGPGGLNLALEFQKRSIPYVLLEGNARVGGQWDRFPRCHELISLNKRNVLFDNFEYARRYDWHTLNGITPEEAKKDPKVLFTNWTDKLFPDARIYADYLRYIAKVYGIEKNIQLGKRVVQIADGENAVVENAKPPKFVLSMADGSQLGAQRLFLATGTSEAYRPKINGLEHAVFYSDFDTDNVERYRNRVVVILGGGNSAFEIAHRLLNVAASISVLSSSGFKYARQTHNVHDIRTQSSLIFDLAQLKSQMNLISDCVTDIQRSPNGRLLLKTRTPQPHWEKPVWTVRNMEVDEVIVCTGFVYTLPGVFTGRLAPELDAREKFCQLNSMWESVNVKDLYFVGGSMRVNDVDAASGFVHGFRCNITALASYIAERHYRQSLQPLFESVLNVRDATTFSAVSEFVTRLVSDSAALFELFNFFCSTVTLEHKEGDLYTCRVFPPLPRAYAQERWGSDCTLAGRVEVVMQYGFAQYGKDTPTHYFTHAGDHFHPERSAYIHPVLHAFRPHSSGGGGSMAGQKSVTWKKTEVVHLQESLMARWDKDDYTDSGTNIDQYVNSVFNALAAALGLKERKDTRPVHEAFEDNAYPLMTTTEVEEAFRREPYLLMQRKAAMP